RLIVLTIEDFLLLCRTHRIHSKFIATL
ncbi:unnamed protein product, partial [Allacma fusca]